MMEQAQMDTDRWHYIERQIEILESNLLNMDRMVHEFRLLHVCVEDSLEHLKCLKGALK